uniref:Uncharacterized protein n=1 Tax=Anguilla anguilla TaxID=7936 RepID=A0A0E9PTI5_ANGAN
MALCWTINVYNTIALISRSRTVL